MKLHRIAIVVGVAAIAVLAWWLLRGRAHTSTTSTAPAKHGSASTTQHADTEVLPAWFARRDVPGRRIAGHVTFEGAPVAGATVTLHSQLTQAGLRAPERKTSGADGAFDFGPHAIASYDVTAEAADRIPAIEHVELADPQAKAEQLDLRLRACEATISGTVFDASGGPIAGARVRKDGLAGAVTDDKGGYKLCVPRGDQTIEYSADGYGSVTLQVMTWGEIRRDVVLVPEATIVVRVLRADDDKPVADAWVMAFPQEWSRDHPSGGGAITDSEGRAQIRRLVPGRYRISGYADGLIAEEPAIALAEVGTTQEVVLRMSAAARITGKVVMGNAPVQNARVVAIRQSPVWRSAQYFTGTDGAFVLERVPLGDVVFVAFPWEVKSPAKLTVDKAKTYDNVVIEVEKLGSIRGRATRNGKPVAGASVCCVQRPNFEPPELLTDGDGRYEYRGVPAGSYSIGGGVENDAFTIGEKITLAKGEDKVVDFEFELAGTISGTVVDKEGTPVPGVFVRWLHEKSGDMGRCGTDQRGKYRCGAMEGGGKYVSAVLPAAGPRQTPFPPAGTYPIVEVKDGKTQVDNVEIAIDYRRLSIQGRVVDANGAGIADAEVKALASVEGQPAQFHSWMNLDHTFTAADGSFTIEKLVTGNYALQAHSADGGEGLLPSVAAGATGVTVKLERPGTIAGKLAGFSSRPTVATRPSDGGFRIVPATVDGTTYRITGLRPGHYVVDAHTSFEGDAKSVDVRAGETAQLDLAAHGRGAIEATVLDFRTRTPINGAACKATPAIDGMLAVINWDSASLPRSDDAGKLTIDPAPAGSIAVACIMSSFRWSQPVTAVELAPGARAQVQLWSVELTQENGNDAGIEFDFWVIAPRVARVRPGASGAKAGVQPGDLVLSVGGTKVEGLNGRGVASLIESYPVGSAVPLIVQRGKETKTLNLVVLPRSGTAD